MSSIMSPTGYTGYYPSPFLDRSCIVPVELDNEFSTEQKEELHRVIDAYETKQNELLNEKHTRQRGCMAIAKRVHRASSLAFIAFAAIGILTGAAAPAAIFAGISVIAWLASKKIYPLILQADNLLKVAVLQNSARKVQFYLFLGANPNIKDILTYSCQREERF